MTKMIRPLEGHEFKASYGTVEDDGLTIGLSHAFAGCTCGWTGRHGHSTDGAATSEIDDAEVRARHEWERMHYPEAAINAVPKDLAERVQAIEDELDELMQVHPLASLRLTIQSGGMFSAKAKAAALQASRDHSWAEIGAAIGISKQAAWERFGKYRPTDPSS